MPNGDIVFGDNCPYCRANRQSHCYKTQTIQLKARIEELKGIGKELLEIIKAANDAIQYIEPKLDKTDEDIFMPFHIKINKLFLR